MGLLPSARTAIHISLSKFVHPECYQSPILRHSQSQQIWFGFAVLGVCCRIFGLVGFSLSSATESSSVIMQLFQHPDRDFRPFGRAAFEDKPQHEA